MLTENLKHQFKCLEQQYGENVLARVKEMLTPNAIKRDFLQKEAKFILPGLSTTPWREVDEYASIRALSKKLEALFPEIKEQIISSSKKNINMHAYDHYKVSLENWKALYLYKDGKILEENLQVVPALKNFIHEIIAKDSLCSLGEMHFSLLKPGVRIPPHADLWNFSLNLHFAVAIPKDCGIRVGHEIRQWEEGKCLLFDYSYEHEAWNNSPQDRMCLLMDLWHPEVTLVERKALTALITEIRTLLG